MRSCANCNSENPDGASLCFQCGHTLLPSRVLLRDAKHLKTERSCFVPIGTGFSGNQLILRIARHYLQPDDIKHRLDLSDVSDEHDLFHSALSTLSETSRAKACKSNIQKSANGDLIYVHPVPIGELFGDTLLERFLGNDSPMDHIVKPEGAFDKQRTQKRATHIFPDEIESRPPKHVRRLIVHLNSGAVYVGTETQDGHVLPETRPYISESLLCFDDINDETSRGHFIFDHEQSSMIACGAWKRLFARRLVALIWTIDKLHQDGRVHGDLRPANILSSSSGLHAIDSLDIEIGGQSVEITPGWAAPEQLLGKPVGPYSDVFSLGVIIAQITGAHIGGDSNDYIVPSSNQERRKLRIIHRPKISLEEQPDISRDARDAWCDLISSCLYFNCDDRISSASGLAKAMQAILDNYDLPGTLTADYQSAFHGPGTRFAIDDKIVSLVGGPLAVHHRRLT